MKKFHENLISPDEAVTLDGLLARRLHRSPDGLAYQAFDRDSKSWTSYTWKERGGAGGALAGGIAPGKTAPG